METSKVTKSERRRRSKSPSRRSRSRSRSRSRGRSKSPSRKARRSPSPPRKVKSSTSPSRKPVEEKSPARKPMQEKPKVLKQTTTPTRQSARIAEINSVKEHGDAETKIVEKILEQKEVLSIPMPKKEYKYGGPIATFLFTLGIPLVAVMLNLICNKKNCNAKQILSLNNLIPRDLNTYYDRNAVLIFLGFVAFQTALTALPMGKLVEGPALKGGKRLKYRLNGLYTLVVSAMIFLSMWYFKCGITVVYEKFFQLLITSIGFSFVASVWLYIKARNLMPSERHPGGYTGCVTHDFALGRELNPRMGLVDLKFLCYRVGVIGWMCINMTFVVVSLQRGQTNYPLYLLIAFQAVQIVETLLYERIILNSLETVQDGVGFLMIVTASTLLPFVYSLQARYLLEHPQSWSYPWLSFFTLLNFTGYFIYHASNLQKDLFRRDPHHPSLANLETMPTTGGKRLMVSGWWGLVRHPNYLGDLIMAVSWALICGCGSAVPYFHLVFLTVLLCDRAVRDGAWCRQKHGAGWERYCQRVKYRIVPFVF